MSKIAVTRKDGKIFYEDGQYAEFIDNEYSNSRLGTVIECNGEKFKIGEIKSISNLDYKESNNNTKTCGKCRDGFLEVETNIGEKMVQCDCAIGNKAQNIILEAKKFFPKKQFNIIREIPHRESITKLQQFKDEDNQYSEIKQTILDILKSWEMGRDFKEYYEALCSSLKQRGKDLETEYYGKY